MPVARGKEPGGSIEFEAGLILEGFEISLGLFGLFLSWYILKLWRRPHIANYDHVRWGQPATFR